ncbi:MAG TPA: hypothetical protein VGA19_04110 [Rhodospirillales bacterium]|jgi:hypothetical protein
MSKAKKMPFDAGRAQKKMEKARQQLDAKRAKQAAEKARRLAERTPV